MSSTVALLLLAVALVVIAGLGGMRTPCAKR